MRFSNKKRKNFPKLFINQSNFNIMKTVSVTLILSGLMLLIGCNPKNESKDETSVPAAKNETTTPEFVRIKTIGTHEVTQPDSAPDSVIIDIAKTAIVIVDMENDFGSKGGMFDRVGVPISAIQKTVPPTADVLAAARKAGIKIIYLKMGYLPDLSDMGDASSIMRIQNNMTHIGDTVIAPDGSKSRIMVRDSWGTEIVPELKPQADDISIYKTRFSGFYNTNLDSTLKKLGKKYLIVTGCTTGVCVESTVRDAMFRDYLSVVLEDCTAEPRDTKEESLNITRSGQFGWVSNSEEFIKAIERKSAAYKE
jgi:ureidoacrylate peracid hydrolase